MQPTRNTLSETIRTLSVELLNKHLVTVIDLHSQMKHASWNIRGPSFIPIHGLFHNVAEDVEDYSERIAERVSGLGGVARGTVRAAAECSFLNPYTLNIADEHQHILAVAGALSAFGRSVREAMDQAATFGDNDTADLFTEISRGIDRQLGLVESHIAPQSDGESRGREAMGFIQTAFRK